MVPEASTPLTHRPQDKGHVSGETPPCVAPDQTISGKSVDVTHRPGLGSEVGHKSKHLGMASGREAQSEAGSGRRHPWRNWEKTQ